MKTHQGKKYTKEERARALGVYFATNNYNLAGTLTGLAPNTIKNIVLEEKQKDPKNFAKLCAKIQKKYSKEAEYYFRVAELRLLDFDFDLFNSMDLDELIRQLKKINAYITRSRKLFYELQQEAINYEARRIERALRLRDVEALTKLLKEAEKDTITYRKIDYKLFDYSTYNDFLDGLKEKPLRTEKTTINKIEAWLRGLGYRVEDIDLDKYLSIAKEGE